MPVYSVLVALESSDPVNEFKVNFNTNLLSDQIADWFPKPHQIEVRNCVDSQWNLERERMSDGAISSLGNRRRNG